jgi:hypothetical protein
VHFNKKKLLSGYQHQDWFVPHPALPDDAWEVKLTPDIARETLNYMGESQIFICLLAFL